MFPSRPGIWNNILNQHALSRDPHPGIHQWNKSLGAAGYSSRAAYMISAPMIFVEEHSPRRKDSQPSQ